MGTRGYGETCAISATRALAGTSQDPYVLTRDVYLQRQDFKAEINNVDEVDEDEEAYLDEYLEDFLVTSVNNKNKRLGFLKAFLAYR